MKRFGELESVVMDRAWKLARPFTVRELHDELKAERTIAYTTVMTVMDKLHAKGWLTRQPKGRAYSYEAVASREEYTARLMREALSTSENHAAAFVHFLGQLSGSEAQALRAALEICPPKRSAEGPAAE